MATSDIDIIAKALPEECCSFCGVSGVPLSPGPSEGSTALVDARPACYVCARECEETNWAFYRARRLGIYKNHGASLQRLSGGLSSYEWEEWASQFYCPGCRRFCTAEMVTTMKSCLRCNSILVRANTADGVPHANLTIEEVARHWKLSEGRLRSLIRRGFVPAAKKEGKLWVFPFALRLDPKSL